MANDFNHADREIFAKADAAGHDTTIAAVTQLLRGLLKASGFADGDPAGQGLSTSTTSIGGTEDSNNSTTSALGSGATFTGTGTDVSDYATISIYVFADQASATDGLVLEVSSDNSNWDKIDEYTINANEGRVLTMSPTAQYFRLKYTNGGTGQGTFRLQTFLRRAAVAANTHPLDRNPIDASEAALTKAVLTAKNAAGNYANIRSTNGNNLKVSVEEFDVAVDYTYDEDTAHQDGDVGVQVLGVRNDTLSALAGTDGDYTPLQVDAEGATYTTEPQGELFGQTETGISAATALNPTTAGVTSGRCYYEVYNNGSESVDIEKSGTTVVEIPAGERWWSEKPLSSANGTYDVNAASSGSVQVTYTE